MKKISLFLFLVLMLCLFNNNVYAVNLDDSQCIVAPGESLSDMQIQAGCNDPIYVDSSGNIINPSNQNGNWDVAPSTVVSPSNAVDPNNANRTPTRNTKNDSNVSSITSTASTLNYANICGEEGVQKAVVIIGYIILVIRILAPLLIIILGMIDFSKAMMSNDENAIKKATTGLIRRLIAGLAVFFIPTILLVLLDVTGVTSGLETKENATFGACTKCILDVGSCDN